MGEVRLATTSEGYSGKGEGGPVLFSNVRVWWLLWEVHVKECLVYPIEASVICGTFGQLCDAPGLMGRHFFGQNSERCL